jgi:hypothetical protein
MGFECVIHIVNIVFHIIEKYNGIIFMISPNGFPEFGVCGGGGDGGHFGI